MNTPNKKSRSVNFSKEEELLLVEAVFQEKEIVECKTSNKISGFEKEQAWHRIADAFNSNNNHKRKADQLKSKYDNLKTRARKVVANQKREIRGTGGGPCSSNTSFDPVIEEVLQLINSRTVVGCNVSFESDCIPYVAIEIGATSDDKLETISEIKESSVLTIEKVDQYQDNVVLHEIILEENVEQPINVPVTEEKIVANWSNYVPRKLKQPISKKLRNYTKNPIATSKEEYYKLKILFIKGEIEERKCKENREILEAQRKEIMETREDERKQVEHEQKMKLYDIDIKIKEQELKIKMYT